MEEIGKLLDSDHLQIETEQSMYDTNYRGHHPGVNIHWLKSLVYCVHVAAAAANISISASSVLPEDKMNVISLIKQHLSVLAAERTYKTTI